MQLTAPIREAGFTFKVNAKKLQRLHIHTLENLLYHIPSRYDDLSLIAPINTLQPEEVVTIQGTILSSKNEYTRRKFQLQKVVVEDNTGKVECIWFNQPYIVKQLVVGKTVSISGKVDKSGSKITIKGKDYELLDGLADDTTHTGKMVPVYPETYGLSSKWVRNRIKQLLQDESITLEEFLPAHIIKKHNLVDIKKALQDIHFPTSYKSIEKARERLAFEELFINQLAGIMRREEWRQKKDAPKLTTDNHKKTIEKYINSLPFELTNAQKKAIDDILADMEKPIPMNRLLEGDVGSGKTVVASVALLAAYLNGYQGVLMAPTEILATQHYTSLSKLLEPFGLNLALFTSSHKKKKEDTFDIAIGTHALIHHAVTFEKLGLVIIDEQQRFGVEQRAILREKGESPHFLTMTATPIPRTIFLTMYGDLDLSYLDEMPKGRKKVKTWLVPSSKREAAYTWIKEKLREDDGSGRKNQVFVICPFIEESENMTTVKAATKEYEKLKKEVFTEFRVSLLHGKMKANEKKEILEQFHKGDFDILVATPVVEVGIDIPHASIMLIEAAERFGLSQLHQLRGRVGRGQKESFCLLFTESNSAQTKKRLKGLETMYLGAELAEYDLSLRGPGEIYGTLQHGVPMFRFASVMDKTLIEKTKKEAEEIFSNLENYPLLQDKVKSTIIQKIMPD